MSGPKFTRAPWMAAASPSSIVGWPIVSCGEGGGRSIASVSWLPGLPDETVEEIRANAQLIAAAPRLHDALEKLARRALEYVGEFAEVDGLECDEELRALAKDGLAAIAEARGDQ